MMVSKEYPMGMTVKELKAAIKDCPEEDIHGDPTEIWIETGKNLSSPVIKMGLLNHRRIDTKEWADILFKSNAFEK